MGILSVIVQTHLEESYPYLLNFIRSLENSDGVELDVILVNSRRTPLPPMPSWIQVVNVDSEISALKANNIGARRSHKDATHIVFCNDDVIVSKYALATMQSFCANTRSIINPISNCDNYWAFLAKFGIKNERTDLSSKRYFTFDEVVGLENAIMNYPKGTDAVIARPMVPGYCALLFKEFYKMIGEHDEGFQLGFADTDFCLRAIKCEGKNFIHMGAFVFHYGGASSNKTIVKSVNEKDAAYFDSKYGENAHKNYI